MIFLDNHSIPTSSSTGLIITVTTLVYILLDLHLYIAYRTYRNMYHYSMCMCVYMLMYISTSDFICKLLFSLNFESRKSSHSFT